MNNRKLGLGKGLFVFVDVVEIGARMYFEMNSLPSRGRKIVFLSQGIASYFNR